jgi:hypothetical protein
MIREEYVARLRLNVEAAEVALSRAARRVDEAEATGSASAEEIAHSRTVTLPRLAALVSQAEKALAAYLKAGA